MIDFIENHEAKLLEILSLTTRHDLTDDIDQMISNDLPKLSNPIDIKQNELKCLNKEKNQLTTQIQQMEQQMNEKIEKNVQLINQYQMKLNEQHGITLVKDKLLWYLLNERGQVIDQEEEAIEAQEEEVIEESKKHQPQI